jgi:hypothetical protein
MLHVIYYFKLLYKVKDHVKYLIHYVEEEFVW